MDESDWPMHQRQVSVRERAVSFFKKKPVVDVYEAPQDALLGGVKRGQLDRSDSGFEQPVYDLAQTHGQVPELRASCETSANTCAKFRTHRLSAHSYCEIDEKADEGMSPWSEDEIGEEDADADKTVVEEKQPRGRGLITKLIDGLKKVRSRSQSPKTSPAPSPLMSSRSSPQVQSPAITPSTSTQTSRRASLRRCDTVVIHSGANSLDRHVTMTSHQYAQINDVPVAENDDLPPITVRHVSEVVEESDIFVVAETDIDENDDEERIEHQDHVEVMISSKHDEIIAESDGEREWTPSNDATLNKHLRPNIASHHVVQPSGQYEHLNLPFEQRHQMQPEQFNHLQN